MSQTIKEAPDGRTREIQIPGHVLGGGGGPANSAGSALTYPGLHYFDWVSDHRWANFDQSCNVDVARIQQGYDRYSIRRPNGFFVERNEGS